MGHRPVTAISAVLLLAAAAAPCAAHGAKLSPERPPAAAKPRPARPAPAPRPPPPELRLFDGATFLLPAGARVSARWIVPPTPQTRIDARFAVSPEGAPLLGLDERLVSPLGRWVAALATAPAAMTYLPGGPLLLAVGRDVGLLAQPASEAADEKGVPRVAFQPLVALPLRRVEALAAAGDDVLCAGFDPARGKYAVYQLRVARGLGPTELLRVHESAEPVTALAGDEAAFYAAAGRVVTRISRSDGTTAVAYVHPAEAVRELALTPAGLVVSSGTELVLAGPRGALEVLRSKGHRIAVQRGTLYVLFERSLGVVALDGLGALAGIDLAVRPVERGEQAPALALAPLRFFETGATEVEPAPPAADAYAERFERKAVRRLIARVDWRAPAARAARVHTVTVTWFEPTGGTLATGAFPVSLGPRAASGTLYAAIGQEPAKEGYAPAHQAGGAVRYRFGTDALGTRYPGRYRVEVEVDGVPAGTAGFELVGEPSPTETIFYDDLPRLKALLAGGLDPRAHQGDTTLLHLAMRFGSARAVEALLEAGANPNENDGEGRPPLAYCPMAAGGWKAKAEALVRRGADLNAKVGPSKDPLVHAIWEPEVVTWLLRKGADVRARSAITGETVLEAAVGPGSCTDERIGAALARGVDVNEVSTRWPNETALGKAILHDDEPCVALLLARGASQRVVRTTPRPQSALFVALSQYRDAHKPATLRIARLLIGAAQGGGPQFSRFFPGVTPGPGHVPLEPGERWIMFDGDNAALFDPTALAVAVLTEDGALERATKSADPEIQALALRAHLSRARDETEAATSDLALRGADEHCAAAVRLAEARWPTLELEVVPARTGAQASPVIGVELGSRAEGGVYVLRTLPGAVAAEAGLQAGDVLLAVGGAAVRAPLDVLPALARAAPGQPVKLRFLRDDGKVPELPLVCGLLAQRLGERERAGMNLSRWLAANPGAAQAAAVRAALEAK
jgi:hypothetical protein